MRTSGTRGAEGWIVAIPLAAIIVATTMSNGGAHEMLVVLEGTIRKTITTVTEFLVRLM